MKMDEYDNIEVELNKTIRHLDWLIIQPDFLDIVSGSRKHWVINKIRLIAVRKWLEGTEVQIDSKLTTDELEGFKNLEGTLKINKK